MIKLSIECMLSIVIALIFFTIGVMLFIFFPYITFGQIFYIVLIGVFVLVIVVIILMIFIIILYQFKR